MNTADIFTSLQKNFSFNLFIFKHTHMLFKLCHTQRLSLMLSVRQAIRRQVTLNLCSRR